MSRRVVRRASTAEVTDPGEAGRGPGGPPARKAGARGEHLPLDGTRATGTDPATRRSTFRVSAEPTPGLEPGTPSLRVTLGTGPSGHCRVLKGTVSTANSRRCGDVRRRRVSSRGAPVFPSRSLRPVGLTPTVLCAVDGVGR